MKLCRYHCARVVVTFLYGDTGDQDHPVSRLARLPAVVLYLSSV